MAKTQFDDWNTIDSVKFNFTQKSNNKFNSYYCENIMTFDIEASNGFINNGIAEGFKHENVLSDPAYYEKMGKASLMYVWQYGLDVDYDVNAYSGRTWNDFKKYMFELSKRIAFHAINPDATYYDDDEYELSMKYYKNVTIHAMCFVHNLGYEYQHLRNLWNNEFSKSTSYRSAVFARTERSPMKFTVRIGKVTWEFRDSYSLVGMSLKAWTKDLDVSKKDEPADFYLPILTPETPLSHERIEYSINDVVSMVYGLRKYKEEFKNLFNIPLTQTGIVRRQAVAKIGAMNPEWSAQCKEVTLSTSWEEYVDLMDLFAGGWTHANSMYTDRLLKNITCFDFASSYPAVMTTRTYPLTKFEQVTSDEYDFLLGLDLKDNELPYHYWLEFEAEGVISLTENTWWSSSKCSVLENAQLDNGKVFSATKLRAKMTDLDFDTFKKTYNTESIKILRMYKSEAGHLPKEFIELILNWYSKKTSFKNVKGKEDEYNSSKRSINGIYGCCVTKEFTDEIIFNDNGWDKYEMTEDDYYEKLQKKEKEISWNMYQIGVWVTAWARHNLFDAIIALDERTVYCDTDSIKGVYTDEDTKWIEEYNKGIFALHEYMSDRYDIPLELYRPVDPDGIVRPIGIFSPDGFYEEFKTLGAKRYCSLEYNKKKDKYEIHTTIAGLPKSAGAKKIEELGGVSAFNSGIVWNTLESHKLTSYYNDNQPEIDWVDMNGNVYHSTDKYGLCLMPTSFDMSYTDEYEAFFSIMQNGMTDNYFEHMTTAYVHHIFEK